MTARLLCMICCSAMWGTSHATEAFNFVSDGEVLATLELRKLPTDDVDDVLGLYFTERGNEIFGFGHVYQGTFDEIPTENFGYLTISPYDGGLGGNNADNLNLAELSDNDPPQSSVVEDVYRLYVRADNSWPDQISMSYPDPSRVDGYNHLTKQGEFVPVPEPRADWRTLSVLLGAAAATIRRRRLALGIFEGSRFEEYKRAYLPDGGRRSPAR